MNSIDQAQSMSASQRSLSGMPTIRPAPHRAALQLCRTAVRDGFAHPLIGHLSAGNLCVVSANDAPDAAALAYNFMADAADHGHCLLLSNRVDAAESIAGMLCVASQSHLAYVRCVLNARKYGLVEQNRIFDTAVNQNLSVCALAKMSIAVIEQQALKLARTRPLNCVMIDALEGIEGGQSARERAILVRALKRLAKTLACPVLLVANTAFESHTAAGLLCRALGSAQAVIDKLLLLTCKSSRRTKPGCGRNWMLLQSDSGGPIARSKIRQAAGMLNYVRLH